jgi:hypothetical protein
MIKKQAQKAESKFWEEVDNVFLLHKRISIAKRREAILLLSNSISVDSRVIAALQLYPNPCLSAKQIKSWLVRERNAEVRRWLYLALPRKCQSMAAPLLQRRLKDKMSTIERLYVLAGLAIAHRSRTYLLDIMRYILSENADVSEKAVILSKMMTNEGDKITEDFIDYLEAKAKIEIKANKIMRAKWKMRSSGQ